ncbi:protein phosphatase [Mycobacterium intermedium]|uniref:Protein phosphatase n=1 Tax=Mycobacterium intermedium TaxID=28445 RepID=A0A1E3SGB1_MYCIE|nr:protein phosphatase [Mycobacterium intermedium]OPE48955.1 protein phosphatase [Mycobacterium intermedium]ORA99000.1 protein phosphatase [Mycobacterium intermedium]
MPSETALERIAVLATQIFDVPMATVAIVDRDRIRRVAAHGMNSEVLELARDDGLCASVIRADTPVVVSDALTDTRTARNQFVHEHGIRFYAGAPIVTRHGHRLGAVAVMSRDARAASAKELEILQNLAAIVMEQLELRLSYLDVLHAEQDLRGAAENARDEARRDRDSAELIRDNAELDRDEARRDRDQARVDRDDAVRDRGIAEHDRDLTEEYAAVLQRTLLPPSLPTIDGLALGSYYRAASSRQIGGDFYDVFPLGGDRWGFFLGDVLGHGPEAAVVTSLIRYTLRAAALHHSDLTRGLAELNSVMMGESAPRRFCTVLFGTIEPHSGGDGFEVRLATGGHPPALLLDPADGSVAEVRPDGGMLVGALDDATFAARGLHLRAGQTLLCYTDGLIEARRGPMPFDEESLAAFAADHAPRGARGLVDDIATLVPKLEPRDDIAVLAFEATA